MAWTHCVQGFIMRWEKYKGLIFKMLQLTIQSKSNLRTFFFLKNSAYCLVSGGYSCSRGCSCWVPVWKMLPFRSPLRCPAAQGLHPGPQCRCQQAGNSPRSPGLVYIPARQGDTKRPNYLLSDLFLCFLCLFLPKLSTHREWVNI